MAILNSSSFPAGSSRAFIDAIIRQQQQVTDTGNKTDENSTQLTQVQKAVNELSSALESTRSTASSALQNANSAQQTASSAQQTANQALANANSAGNGVGDLNMNAVLKNVTAVQTVGGPLGASQFNVGGNKVVGARVGGWTPSTGTEQRGGLNADQQFNASAAYSQGEAQAMGLALAEARRTIHSLYVALAAHGLIG